MIFPVFNALVKSPSAPQVLSICSPTVSTWSSLQIAHLTTPSFDNFVVVVVQILNLLNIVGFSVRSYNYTNSKNVNFKPCVSVL